MSDRSAAVRAPLTKAILEQLDLQSPEVVRAVRERVPGAIKRVEDCSRVDWIPLGVQLEVLGAIRDVVGGPEYDAFCIAHFASTIEQPFVKGMFETTVRLFGLGPLPIFRVFTKTWSVISRDAGELSLDPESTPSATTLYFRQLPVDEPRIDLFVSGYRATFQGVLQVAHVRGEATLAAFSQRAREATYRIRWEERG